jgi:hypothetical protein
MDVVEDKYDSKTLPCSTAREESIPAIEDEKACSESYATHLVRDL